MYGSEIGSEIARKTLAFDLPVKRKRDKSYKIPPGSLVFTCFTSDFLLEDADAWRPDCWAMIRERRDCRFYFFTKRIHRFLECVPDDWGDGYDNVIVGCTVENQAMADQRLPIFSSLPIKYKTIIVAPMIDRIDLSNHLIPSIQEVSCGGESGRDARPLDFDWVLSLREQCIQSGIPFRFHQTGAKLIKDSKLYYIRRCYQHEQAKKAGVDSL
jgi:protein gp37